MRAQKKQFPISNQLVLMTMRSTSRIYWLAAESLLLIAWTAASNLCAQTNLPAFTEWDSVKDNLFFTDNDHHLAGQSEKLLIRTDQLLEARRSPECRPADEDPEGHWGQPGGGMQLSVRFRQLVYTNGQPVVAMALVRNVSGHDLWWPLFYDPPVNNMAFVVFGPDGNELPGAKQTIDWMGGRRWQLGRQTQLRYDIRLDERYELKQTGRYRIQATSLIDSPERRGPPEHPGLVEIKSGEAVIEIVEPQKH